MRAIFTTQGRLARSSFWHVQALLATVICVFGEACTADFLPEMVVLLAALAMLPFFLFSLTVQIRRWHDRNKSGWWVLLNFVPVLGQLWILLECGLLRGTIGDNRFGCDPVIDRAKLLQTLAELEK